MQRADIPRGRYWLIVAAPNRVAIAWHRRPVVVAITPHEVEALGELHRYELAYPHTGAALVTWSAVDGFDVSVDHLHRESMDWLTEDLCAGFSAGGVAADMLSAIERFQEIVGVDFARRIPSYFNDDSHERN